MGLDSPGLKPETSNTQMAECDCFLCCTWKKCDVK